MLSLYNFLYKNIRHGAGPIFCYLNRCDRGLLVDAIKQMPSISDKNIIELYQFSYIR